MKLIRINDESPRICNELDVTQKAFACLSWQPNTLMPKQERETNTCNRRTIGANHVLVPDFALKAVRRFLN